MSRQHALLVAVVVLIVSVIALYWQTFARIMQMWSLWDYQYGWLVYPVCLYIILTKRDELAGVRIRGSLLGFCLVVALVCGWLLARAAAIQVAEFVSATLLIYATVWAVMGTAVIRVLAFPLLFFLAAVPMGAFLVEPLMKATAEIAAFLLALSGVPVLRDNQFFFLSGGSFEVADVCSGFRYLLSGTILSLAFVYTAYTKMLPRVMFVILSAIVLVITNGVRAFIVMAVASATEMRVFGGADHVWFGTILFVIVFFAMVWFGEKYADSQESGASTGGVESQKGTTALTVAGTMGAAALILLSGPLLWAAAAERDAATIGNLPLPEPQGCTRDATHLATGELPTFQNVDAEWHELFDCGEFRLGVYAASYGVQEQGKELVAWGNRVWPNDWRRYVDKSTAVLDAGNGQEDVNQVLVRLPEGWRLIWYWYQVGSSKTSSDAYVKVLEALQVLTLRSAESSVVVVWVAGEDEDNLDALTTNIERHAVPFMRWNRDRIERGERE